MKEKILIMLREVQPYEDILESTELIKSGLLSSLEIFSLITEIEFTFDITLKDEDVILENFASAGAIEKMLSKYEV